MTQAKSDEDNAQVKAKRAARRAELRAEKNRVAQEVKTRRQQQLEITQAALTKLEQRLRSGEQNNNSFEALSNHLAGFYEEIDKLAKGKSMLEVTELVVEQANNVIRDAKNIVEGDTYLDRVKEFVPAGDNPVYPDVLLTLRTVQQCLSRFGAGRVDRDKHLVKILHEARTILGALQCYMAGNEYPSKDDVKNTLDEGSPVSSWFFRSDYDDGDYFDFERLDRRKLDDYLSVNVVFPEKHEK